MHPGSDPQPRPRRRHRGRRRPVARGARRRVAGLGRGRRRGHRRRRRVRPGARDRAPAVAPRRRPRLAGAGPRRGGRGRGRRDPAGRRVGKDESDAELALLAAVERGATRITRPRRARRRAPRPRAREPVAPRPSGPAGDGGRAPRRAVARVAHHGAGSRRRRRSRASLPGPVGATVSLLPLGGDVSGVTTRRPSLSAPRRAAARRAGPRALERARARGRARDASSTGGSSSWSPFSGRQGYPRSHEHPAAWRPGPRGRAPRRDRHDPPPCGPDRLAGPSSTSIPRTTRPAARPRPARSATCTATSPATDAEIWGISPDGSGSHAAFRAKYGLPFTLLSDEDHAVAEAYGAWREKTNYGKTYMGIARSSFLVDPDGRIARTWANVKADGHAEQVLAALSEARAGRVRLTRPGHGVRLRPWGETSEASGANLAQRPGCLHSSATVRDHPDVRIPRGLRRCPRPPPRRPTPGARSGSW